MEKDNIKEVFVASSVYRVDLNETVNRFLADGWKIHSELIVTPTSSGGVVYTILLVK